MCQLINYLSQPCTQHVPLFVRIGGCMGGAGGGPLMGGGIATGYGY
jgi:hypothetical protein